MLSPLGPPPMSKISVPNPTLLSKIFLTTASRHWLRSSTALSNYFFPRHRLLGLKRSPTKRKVKGSIPACPVGIFQVESYQWHKNWYSSGYPARCLAVQDQRWDWLARCQYTVTGWRRNVWSATSISVWQQVKSSEQIRPWGTLACCLDVKQATKLTNKQANLTPAPHHRESFLASLPQYWVFYRNPPPRY